MTASNNDARRKTVARAADHGAEPNEEFELDIDVSFDDDEEDYLDEVAVDIDEELLDEELLDEELLDEELLDEELLDEELLDEELLAEEVLPDLDEEDLSDEGLMLSVDDSHVESIVEEAPEDEGVEHHLGSSEVVEALNDEDALALIEEEVVLAPPAAPSAPPSLPPVAPPVRPSGEHRVLARVNVIKSTASMVAAPQNNSRELLRKLELRHQELQGECMALETQLNKARATIEQQQRDLDALRASQSSAIGEGQRAEELQAQLTAAEAQLSQVGLEQQVLLERVEQARLLETQLDEARAKLQHADEQVDSLQSYREAAEARIQEVDAQRLRVQALFEDAEAQRHAAQGHLDELQAQLEGSEAALLEFKASAEQRAAESQQRVETLEASMAAAQEEAAQKQAAAEQQIKTLEEQVAVVVAQQAQQALDAEAQRALHAEAQQALHSENESLVERVQSLEAERDAAQQQSEARHQDVVRLEASNAQLQEDLAGLRQVQADTQAQVHALEEENQARAAQLAELGAEKESLSVELNGAHDELRSLSARLETALQQQGALEERLRDMDTARAQAEAAFGSLKDEHNALHGAHAELLERFAQFREESAQSAAALTEERDALREESAEQVRAMDAMRVEHERGLADVQERAAAERNVIEGERDASREALEAARAELEHTRAVEVELRQALSDAQAAHQESSAAYEQAQAELAERPTHEALLELQASVVELTQERDLLVEQHEQQQGEIEKLVQKGQRLGAEYGELTEVYDSLQREHIDRGKQLMSALTDGERQRASLERFGDELAAVREEANTLSALNQELSTQNAQLQANNAQLQENNAQLLGELDVLQAQAERFAEDARRASLGPAAEAGNVDDILDDALEENAEQLVAMGLAEPSSFDEDDISGVIGMSIHSADDGAGVEDNAAPRMSLMGESDDLDAPEYSQSELEGRPVASQVDVTDRMSGDFDDPVLDHEGRDRAAPRPINPVGRSTSRYRFVHDEQFERSDSEHPATDSLADEEFLANDAEFLGDPDSYADYDVSGDDFEELLGLEAGRAPSEGSAVNAFVEDDDFGEQLFGADSSSRDEAEAHSHHGAEEPHGDDARRAAFDEDDFIAEDFGDDADFGAEFIDPFSPENPADASERAQNVVSGSADESVMSGQQSVAEGDLAMLVSSTLGDAELHRQAIVAEAAVQDDELDDPMEYLQRQGLMDVCPMADFAMAQGVDHRAGFLLAMANGSTTTRDIIELSGGVLEGSTAARLVLSLFNSGALSV